MEAAEVPLLGRDAAGDRDAAWLTTASGRWTGLSVLTLVIMFVIAWLSVGRSWDYNVWINTMTHMDRNAWQSAVFATAGDLTTLFLIYSPMDGFIEVFNARNVGGRTHIANVAAVVNCLVWTWYGAVLATVNYSVVVTNLTGVFFHTGYFLVYFICCPGRRAFFYTLVMIGVGFAMAIAGTCFWLESAGSDLPQVVGMSGLVTGIIMYFGGTADNMMIVHQTNGEEGQTALVATFSNAFLWMVYAMIIGDTSMLIPSVFGIAVCVIQILQRALYRFCMPADELEAWLVGAVSGVVAWAKAKVVVAWAKAKAKLVVARGKATGTAAAPGETTGTAAAPAEGSSTEVAAPGEMTGSAVALAEGSSTEVTGDNNGGQP